MTAPAAEAAFRRLIVGAVTAPIASGALTLSARLAAELELEIEGLYIEDESLLGLAALPSRREVRLGSGRLEPLDAQCLEQALGRAAKTLEASLARAAGAARALHRFRLARGDLATVIGANVTRSDIVAVVAGGALHPGHDLHLAAMQARASVLLIPSRLARRPGAIVALMSGGPMDERTVTLAARLAARRRERLEVFALTVDPSSSERVARIAEQHRLDGSRWSLRPLPQARTASVAHALANALGGVTQRLLVLPRNLPGLVEARDLAGLAATLCAPLLVLEPPEEIS